MSNEQNPAAASAAPDRVTVSLAPQARDALAEIMQAEVRGPTAVINRALQLYAVVTAGTRQGARLALVWPQNEATQPGRTGPVEFLHLI